MEHNRASILGLPPTNKQVTYSGINIFRIAEGKIAEIWDISDRLWLWQQLVFYLILKKRLSKQRNLCLAHQSDKNGVDS